MLAPKPCIVRLSWTLYLMTTKSFPVSQNDWVKRTIEMILSKEFLKSEPIWQYTFFVATLVKVWILFWHPLWQSFSWNKLEKLWPLYPFTYDFHDVWFVWIKNLGKKTYCRGLVKKKEHYEVWIIPPLIDCFEKVGTFHVKK